MKLPSLRLRLLALSAISVGVTLVVAGLAFAAIFANHVQRSLEAGLTAELERLVALVDPGPDQPVLLSPLPDARYEIPAGGVYWQVRDPANRQLARSRSLWDAALTLPKSLPADGSPLATPVPGPDGGSVLVLARTLTFERGNGAGERVLEVAVAGDMAAVDAANSAFRTDLARALAVLAIVLLATSWMQILLGLSPLSLIKRGVSRIRTGQAKALSGEFPAEVMPLVSEVNDLLRTQERSMQFARERAADLAHGLKTSLTLLNGEAFELRNAGNAAAADRLETLSATMTETIDHQLRLARLRHRSRSDFRTSRLADITDKVVAALMATPSGKALEWRTEIAPGTTVALDAMDLTELMGVLLENGAQWARSVVALSTRVAGGRVHLTVGDDGPGLESDAMASLGRRGQRLDQRRPGHGLGIAIAREIVTLNGGKLSFARSPLGGLQVEIELHQGATGI